MASFIQTGNPNVHKLTNESVVDVPRMGEGKQFLVTKDGLRQGRLEMLEKRCAFWLKHAAKVPF
jgi:hypothetical protein